MKTQKTAWRNVPHGPVFLPERERRRVHEAVLGVRHVSINVADDRHMFHQNPGPLDFHNEFDVQHWGLIPVPRMCEIMHVDPNVIQDIYAHYRGDELHAHTSRRIRSSILRERRQIITDLFYFNELGWWRETPSSGRAKGIEMIPLGILRRRDVVHNLRSIADRCCKSKEAAERAMQLRAVSA